jgi:hypothetical protein
VDDIGDSGRGAAEGLAGEETEATRWINTEGRRMLVEYLGIEPLVAARHIERWRRDLQDDDKLAEIIQGADRSGYIGARFHTIITEQWRRHVALKTAGAQLPLMPPRPSERRGPAEAAAPAAELPKRSAS